MQSLPVEVARRLQAETNLESIRRILSLEANTDVGSIIDAIISHPDGRMQEETCHLLNQALGSMMPWRDITDLMLAFEDYPHPNFLEYASTMAQTVPAPWNKTLAPAEETAIAGPFIDDQIYQMMVTSVIEDGTERVTLTPAAKAWGLCNPGEGSFRPGKLIDQSYRMMACERYLVPGEEDTESWYTGICQACEEEIPEMGSALRHPLNDGGWMGCFCGFRCLAASSPHEELFKISSMELLEGCTFSFSLAQHARNEDEGEARAQLADQLERGPDDE